MKNIILLLITFLVVECRETGSNDSSTQDIVKSSVSGKVYDYQRNIPVSNFPVKLFRQYSDFCGYMSCIKNEEIATAYSDQNGNYIINFNYIKDLTKKNYGYVIKVENYSNHIAENLQTTTINPGNNNTVNINAWEVVRLKIHLSILNNNNPPLYIATRLTTESGTFNNTAVNGNGEQDIELMAKPSWNMVLRFYYFLNNQIHFIDKQVNTNNDDFQNFNFTIDCALF